MSGPEKKAYTGAVNCLLQQPSKLQASGFAPGARNRYDDFVGVHINQTLSIHGTVSTSESEKSRLGGQLLTHYRVTSSLGTDTSSGRTRTPSERNAAMMATSR